MIRTAINLFLAWKRAENLSPRTIDWYRDNLTAFADDLSSPHIRDITPSTIVMHLARLLDAGYAPSSVEGRYRALFAFFNWSEGCGELGNPPSPIGHGPRRNVKRPKLPQSEPEHVPYEDYRQMVDSIDLANWLDYRDFCLISCLFWTGLRRSELLALRIPDADLTRCTLHIRHGKGNKSRRQPIDQELAHAIASYVSIRPQHPTPDLWLAYDRDRIKIRGPLQETGLRTMLQRRAHRAGVRYWHPHAWRHGYAMAMLNAGAELSAVSTMMGHSSVKVTESIYARWQMDALAGQYNQAAARIRGT